MRIILLLAAAIFLSGCSTAQLNKIAKYEGADVDAAIAIATKANDSARLACYMAVRNQLAIQAMVKGVLSQDEALRVGAVTLTMACSNL